jgi:hypothetical protein
MKVSSELVHEWVPAVKRDSSPSCRKVPVSRSVTDIPVRCACQDDGTGQLHNGMRRHASALAPVSPNQTWGMTGRPPARPFIDSRGSTQQLNNDVTMLVLRRRGDVRIQKK